MNPSPIIDWLQSLPIAITWIIQLFLSYGALLVFLKLWGADGVIVFCVLAIVAANIQVLKAVEFPIWVEPIALGTLIFSTTYLATDILTEIYGKAKAMQAVYIGFAGYLLFTGWMLLTIGFAPLSQEQYPNYQWAIDNHNFISGVFTPAPTLLIAGMVSFLISQWLDVSLFSKLKKLTSGKYLWLRNNLSTAISGLLDSFIFSVLAWIILNPEPLPWGIVVSSYVFGTYTLRLLLTFLDTPIIYLAKKIHHDQKAKITPEKYPQ